MHLFSKVSPILSILSLLTPLDWAPFDGTFPQVNHVYQPFTIKTTQQLFMHTYLPISHVACFTGGLYMRLERDVSLEKTLRKGKK